MVSLKAALSTATLEHRVTDKVRRKINRIKAERQAAEQHGPEVLSWARVADAAETRRWTYEQRLDWSRKAVAAGLCDAEEAIELARLKFPL